MRNLGRAIFVARRSRCLKSGLDRSFCIVKIERTGGHRPTLMDLATGHGDREKLAFGREFAHSGGGKGFADLEEFHVPPLMVKIEPQGAEQAGNKRWPHSNGAFDDRVLKCDELFLAALAKELGNGRKGVIVADVDEAIGDRFVKSLIDKRSAEAAFPNLARLIFTRTKRRRKFILDVLVTRVAGDLFYQVFLDGDVVPPGWRFILALAGPLKAERGENSLAFVRRDIEPGKPLNSR